MEKEQEMFFREDGEGKTPWFLKLAFLFLILWAACYIWKNVRIG